jgi:Ca2+-binding EF-hand superfamily protein
MPSFSQLDANTDGSVSPSEFSAAMKAQTTSLFKRLDADGDGTLSAEELAKSPGPGRGRGPERGSDR